jgi:uncharacterized protein YkwD
VKRNWSHFFIPQKSNNFRAAILKNGFLALLLGIYLLNQAFIKYLSLTKPGVLGYSSEITAQKVFDQTNQQRTTLGLKPLTYNSLLSQSATKKAEDMFANNYWAHNSPKGTTPWDFFKSVGYQYSVAGENLARDFYDTDSLMKAWMNSPTHKANIVNSKYQEIGVGVVNGTLGGIKTTLVVQHFGTPVIAVTESKKTEPQKPIVSKDIIVNDEQNKIVETAPQESKNQVLSQNQQNYINPLTLNKVFGLIIFSLIIIVLFIDGYITLKHGIHRMTGSTVGHIGFLLVILLFILYQQQGVIF